MRVERVSVHTRSPTGRSGFDASVTRALSLNAGRAVIERNSRDCSLAVTLHYAPVRFFIHVYAPT